MAGSRAKLSVDAAAFVPDFIQAAAPASAVTGPLNVDAMIAIEREMLSASLRTAVVASLQEKHGATASFILVSTMRCATGGEPAAAIRMAAPASPASAALRFRSLPAADPLGRAPPRPAARRWQRPGPHA